jgi:pimeloyl-ACP methyl ester carboxylesterase
MADVTVRGVRLHYQRLGDPDADVRVVFLHGLVMDNLASYYFTLANAAASHADVLLYDLRGHGRSERPTTGYALADMVEDLAALLDATLGARAVHLVGNSFGGLLALAFARQFPERVAGVVLIDAHVGGDGFGEQMASTLALTGEERDRRIADSFQHWLGRHSSRKRTRLAESAQDLVTRTSLVADMRRTPPLGADDLAAIDAPVLALYGARSDILEASERALSTMPRATIRIVPGCTHSLLWEATDLVRDAVIDFLTGAESSRDPAPTTALPAMPSEAGS